VEAVSLLADLAWEIADRKRAEEALRASEERYRSLIYRVRTAIVVHDGKGRLLKSNPLAQELLGLSEDLLLGKSLIDPKWHFLREDGSVLPVAEYPVSLVLSTQRPLRDYEMGISRPERNGVTWALVNAEPEFGDEGEIAEVVVSFVDISERKKAEEQLRQHLSELQRWHDVTLNREERVQELKLEVNQLLTQLGEPPRYKSQGWRT
jgi:PAS domain S-box-containing protein